MRRQGDPRAAALLERFTRIFGPAGPPVPALRIAEDLLGLRVHLQDGLPVSGMLIPAERRIVLCGGDTPARRLFTLAHEIGHWELHCGARPTGPIRCRDVAAGGGVDPLEREANVFAADLLMPADALSGDAAAPAPLAERFGVSPEAMAWRLYNLGLSLRPPEG